MPRLSLAVGIPGVKGERYRFRVMHLEDWHGKLGGLYARKALEVLLELPMYLPFVNCLFFERHCLKLPCRLNVVVYVSAFTVQPTLVF